MGLGAGTIDVGDVRDGVDVTGVGGLLPEPEHRAFEVRGSRISSELVPPSSRLPSPKSLLSRSSSFSEYSLLGSYLRSVLIPITTLTPINLHPPLPPSPFT